MTDANKLQTGVWLGDLYTHFLQAAAMSRNQDTAVLRSLAVKGWVQTAHDAKRYGLVDDLKYDDQIKASISKKLRQEIKNKINFVSLSDYAQAADYALDGSEKIALVFANGDIVSGQGDDEMIGSDSYKNILRKIRLDKSIKAVVFRINSGGGSSLASEVIWREISLIRKESLWWLVWVIWLLLADIILLVMRILFLPMPIPLLVLLEYLVLCPICNPFKNKIGVTFDGVNCTLCRYGRCE